MVSKFILDADFLHRRKASRQMQFLPEKFNKRKWQNYIDNVLENLDHHIDAVLDYSALGEQIADSDDEYVSLSSGRIIEFEL